jgi:hypothetical protein
LLVARMDLFLHKDIFMSLNTQVALGGRPHLGYG